MSELRLNTDGHIIKFGADNDINITHVADTGLTTNGAFTASGSITVGGTTPTLTIGDAGAEDAKIVFDGNAQDFHIGLDDTDDSIKIGLGSALGTTAHIISDATGAVTKPLQPAFLAKTEEATGNIADVANDNSQTVIRFATEIFDQNGDYDASNGIFTSPVAGRYLFTYNVPLFNVDSAATFVALRYISSNRSIDVNIFRPLFAGDLDRHTITGSIIGDMDASDTAKLTIAQYQGTAQMDIESAHGTFSGCLLA